MNGYQNIIESNMSGSHTQDIQMMKEINQNSKVNMIM